MSQKSLVKWAPAAHPTNDIPIKFEIRPKFEVLWFKMYSSDYNKILHMSWQCNCCNVCKILLWTAEHVSNYSTPNFEFDRNTFSGTGAWCPIALVNQ